MVSNRRLAAHSGICLTWLITASWSPPVVDGALILAVLFSSFDLMLAHWGVRW